MSNKKNEENSDIVETILLLEKLMVSYIKIIFILLIPSSVF